MPWFVSDEKSKMAFLTMTLHQGGTSRMYELTLDTQPPLLGTFSGDRRFSRFGGILHLSDLDGDGLGRRGTGPLAKNWLPSHQTAPELGHLGSALSIDSSVTQGL